LLINLFLIDEFSATHPSLVSVRASHEDGVKNYHGWAREEKHLEDVQQVLGREVRIDKVSYD
jgi:hypothetical protein